MNKIIALQVGVLSFSFSSFAHCGEMNFSGIFNSFAKDKVTQHREIEEKLENDIATFRSVKSSRVVIPVDNAKTENIWGVGDARVLPVEVILKLKKRRRLTQNEYTSIGNLVSSALSTKNQMIQAVIRDEEGFEWNDDSSQSKNYFKAAAVEHEIVDRLRNLKEVSWSNVHVSEVDSSCKIFGSYERVLDNTDIQVRRNVMDTLGDLCASARLQIAPPKGSVQKAQSFTVLMILEKLAYVLLGFSLWGLFSAIRKFKNARDTQGASKFSEDDDAIILTQIVDRSPDQAAKWMVKAMLAEPATEEESKKPQIFDQSL